MRSKLETFDHFSSQIAALLGVNLETNLHAAPRAAHPGSPRAAADSFVKSLGYSGLGDAWWDVSEMGDHIGNATPPEFLAASLQRTLAYGEPMLSAEMSDCVAREFLSYFQEGETILLTNRIGNGWNPITSSTLEAVFVAIDAVSIGVLILQDED